MPLGGPGGRGGQEQAIAQGEPPPPRWVGGSEAKKQVGVPKIGPKFPAPLMNFILCPRKIFLKFGGGGVGGGWPEPQTSPPLGSQSHSLVSGVGRARALEGACTGC